MTTPKPRLQLVPPGLSDSPESGIEQVAQHPLTAQVHLNLVKLNSGIDPTQGNGTGPKVVIDTPSGSIPAFMKMIKAPDLDEVLASTIYDPEPPEYTYFLLSLEKEVSINGRPVSAIIYNLEWPEKVSVYYVDEESDEVDIFDEHSPVGDFRAQDETYSIAARLLGSYVEGL